MGKSFEYEPSKLVIGILISQPDLKPSLIEELCNKFGPVDFESDLMDFTFSTYYNKEMGTPIKKFFLSFETPVSPDRIAEIKMFTNELEKKYYREGKRKVNLDPGHLFLSKFILSTTKDGSHRLPLHSGIYAEITLMYQKNTFRKLEWTYPDFSHEDYINILNHIRTIYKPQLKNPRSGV